MISKECIGYLENIRDMFVIGSENCEEQALANQQKFIDALNYAMKLINDVEIEQGDLISREALLKAVEEERQYLLANGQMGAEHILVHHCLRFIYDAPTVMKILINRCG